MKKPSPLIYLLLAALPLCLTASAQAQSARRTGSGSRPPSASSITAAEKPLPPGWKLYRFGDARDGWSLAFPVEPVEKTAPLKAEGVGSLIMHTFDGRTRSGSYGALYIDLPSGLSQPALDERRESLYALLWKEVVSGMEEGIRGGGFKDVVMSPLTQRKVSVNGYEGRERDFLIGPAKARLRIVFTERRVYTLVAMWIKEGFEEERDSFFDLFEIRPER
jgi:hypothetical protein